MRMSKPEKKPLVPALRFPEFQNAEGWKPEELGAKTKKVGSGITPKGGDKNYKIDGRPFVRSQNVGWGFLILDDVAYIDDETHSSFLSTEIQKDDVLLNITGASIGRSSVANQLIEGGNVNQHVCIIRTKQKELNPFFLNQFLVSQAGQKQIDSFQAGGNRQGLNFAQIRSFSIPVPPRIEEQQKIADCLSSIDDLITAQTQKLAALKAHKKGLMQQLFPAEGETVPKLRFPEFRDGGGWKSYHLGEIASFSKGKGISKANIAIDGKLPCIRYGELYTFYGEVIKEVNSRTNLPTKDLVLSKANDVIIPASGETQEDIATASCVKENGIALGGDLNIIRTKNDGIFLAYYLNSAKKKDIAQMAQGISVIHLYANQLKTLNVQLPEVQEQQKIADCLSSIDELIAAQSQKIEALKSHKKGLMQQLFPSMDEVDG